MSWKAVDTVSLRLEFVKLAAVEGCNMTELCRRFEVSRRTGYKWLTRYRELGEDGLVDQSRRPRTSPKTSDNKIIDAIKDVRGLHPAWGARKIQRRLKDLEHTNVPAVSTVNDILKRSGLISEEASRKARSFQRFEYENPNDLWQMDFKGHFAMKDGSRCHPLTILDDHSRFSIGLRAMNNERGQPVKRQLTGVFRRFGLPYAMLMDNGSPWGTSSSDGLTKFEIWLMQLGIRVIHSRPRHPQTNGKDERFHRTLDVELIQGRVFDGLPRTQKLFDSFRETYNHQRPHEALNMDVPAKHYQASTRCFPEQIPNWDYGDQVEVRKVDASNRVYFQGKRIRVSKGLIGQYVALDEASIDNTFHIRFRNTTITTIDLSNY